MVIPFVRSIKDVNYQRRLAAFLATWQRDRTTPTVLDVTYSGFDKNWDDIWLVVNRRYWPREHCFETRVPRCSNLLVDSLNVEIFPVMPADRCGLYPVLPSQLSEFH